MFFSSDFLQLPPVMRKGETKRFCFETAAWRSCVQRTINLKKVMTNVYWVTYYCIATLLYGPKEVLRHWCLFLCHWVDLNWNLIWMLSSWQVFRQKEEGIISLLNRIRVGQITESDIQTLERCKHTTFPNDGIKPTILFPDRYSCGRVNSNKVETS